MKLSTSFSESNKIFENNGCQHTPNSYKWTKESPYLFQKAFNTDEVKQMVITFIGSPFGVENDVFSTDQAVDNFNSSINTACSKSLKQVNSVSNRKSKN